MLSSDILMKIVTYIGLLENLIGNMFESETSSFPTWLHQNKFSIRKVVIMNSEE